MTRNDSMTPFAWRSRSGCRLSHRATTSNGYRTLAARCTIIAVNPNAVQHVTYLGAYTAYPMNFCLREIPLGGESSLLLARVTDSRLKKENVPIHLFPCIMSLAYIIESYFFFHAILVELVCSEIKTTLISFRDEKASRYLSENW